jgi:hypothetical protein
MRLLRFLLLYSVFLLINVAQSGFAKVSSNIVSLEEPQSQDSHRHRSQSEGRSKHPVHNIPNIRENANDYHTGQQSTGKAKKNVEDQTRKSRPGPQQQQSDTRSQTPHWDTNQQGVGNRDFALHPLYGNQSRDQQHDPAQSDQEDANDSELLGGVERPGSACCLGIAPLATAVRQPSERRLDYGQQEEVEPCAVWVQAILTDGADYHKPHEKKPDERSRHASTPTEVKASWAAERQC